MLQSYPTLIRHSTSNYTVKCRRRFDVKVSMPNFCFKVQHFFNVKFDEFFTSKGHRNSKISSKVFLKKSIRFVEFNTVNIHSLTVSAILVSGHPQRDDWYWSIFLPLLLDDWQRWKWIIHVWYGVHPCLCSWCWESFFSVSQPPFFDVVGSRVTFFVQNLCGIFPIDDMIVLNTIADLFCSVTDCFLVWRGKLPCQLSYWVSS